MSSDYVKEKNKGRKGEREGRRKEGRKERTKGGREEGREGNKVLTQRGAVPSWWSHSPLLLLAKETTYG